jgi:hypothetical protein
MFCLMLTFQSVIDVGLLIGLGIESSFTESFFSRVKYFYIVGLEDSAVQEYQRVCPYFEFTKNVLLSAAH